jgi:hypothetical protein
VIAVARTRFLNEAHTPQRDLRIRELLAHMLHDSCGQPARAELLSGIEGASSRPVRRIVLRSGS